MTEIPLITNEIFNPFSDVFTQISNLIEHHNSTHSSEMLPKTPQELEKIYKNGFSVIAVDPRNGNVIGHAALYPLLDTNINEVDLRIVEFGSWIVAPLYRHHRINGLTIGEAIAKELILRFPDLPIIATVKRRNSFYGLQRIGFKGLNFYELPFIAALTCVCGNSSEHFGHQCSYRRKESDEIENSNLKLDFKLGNNNEPSAIPCTLLGYNLEVLRQLNESLKQLIFPDQPSPADLTAIFNATRNFFRSSGIEII